MTAVQRLTNTVVAGIAVSAMAICPSKAASAEAGTHQFDLPGAAPFALYRPAAVNLATPAPLVLLLHGSSGEGTSMLSNASLKSAADKYGFVIAAPTGAIRLAQGYAWNIPGVATVNGTVPGASERDDVGYLLSIIDALVSQGIADRSRVYATGISGGGRMTSWLGCVASTRLAAIAPVVGLRAGVPLASDPSRPAPDSCQPQAPLPILAFAGDSDTTNPIAGGGAKYWQYSMQAAQSRWAALNGCTQPPARQRISASVYQERYDGCRDGAIVSARITEGGGHTWVADDDAMWRFFAQYARAPDGKLLQTGR